MLKKYDESLLIVIEEKIKFRGNALSILKKKSLF